MGKGFDVIVNTLPDSYNLKSIIKCLGKDEPKFFQVTVPTMESTFSIGKVFFLSFIIVNETKINSILILIKI